MTEEMQMARSINSDYIDLSLMGGFDLGINFDGFQENVKKIMELPIKYLDSAHDKAIELIEDVHAILWVPLSDGEVPNKPHETFEDPSSSNTVTELSPTYSEMKLVGVNAEVSTPASPTTVKNGFAGCISMDAHETESVLTKNPENTSTKGDHIEAKNLCLLAEDTLTAELYDSTTSEEIILWSPENSMKRRQPEPTTVSKEDYVPHLLDTGKGTEQVGHHCSSHSDILVESSVFYGAIPLENSSADSGEHVVLHSANDPVEATTHETISHDLSTDVSSFTGDLAMYPDDTAKHVASRLRNGQQNMKSEKVVGSYVILRPNTSFKKMFMRNLLNKLGWSKKQTSVEKAVPDRSQDGENLGYQIVSSSDDLDDDWEVL